MNKKFSLNNRSLRLMYFRYKGTPAYNGTLAGLGILLGIALLYFFVIPQLTNWFSIQHEVTATQDRIRVIKANTQIIGNMSKTDLSNKFTIASAALPSEKDFSGILEAISSSASEAHASLSDYSFALGELKSEKKQEMASVRVDVVIKSSFASAKDFLSRLQEKAPLSEVSLMDMGDTNSTFTILFYYKPLENPILDDASPIQLLDAKKEALLAKLQQWEAGIGM